MEDYPVSVSYRFVANSAAKNSLETIEIAIPGLSRSSFPLQGADQMNMEFPYFARTVFYVGSMMGFHVSLGESVKCWIPIDVQVQWLRFSVV